MFRLSAKFVIVLIACSFLIPDLSWSQTPNEVVRAIEKLDRDLKLVREIVHTFKNTKAWDLVLRAETLRNEAVQAIQNKKFGVASNKIKVAFSILEQAVKITLDGPVRRWRSRLEEKLRKAEHEIQGRQYKEAERILRQAKANRDAAERALANQHVRKAIELFRVALNQVDKALDMVHKANSSTLDRILEEKRKFEILKDRAHDLIVKSRDVRAKQIYDQAIKLAISAEESVRNGNFQLAKKFYNQSVLLLLRAMDIAKGDTPASVSHVEAALFRLREHIDSAREGIQQSDNQRAKILFERARRFASEAELAAKNGHAHEAMWKIELAENMIVQARRLAENKDRPGLSRRIVQEIENAKSDMAEMKSQMAADVSKDILVLLNMAEFAIARAEQASRTGHVRFALESVLAAQKFLSRAERLLNAHETTAVSLRKIQQRLSQLDQAITEAEKRISASGQEWNQRMLEGAKEIRQFVVQALQKGNLSAAEEGIQVAFELVRKSLKGLPKN